MKSSKRLSPMHSRSTPPVKGCLNIKVSYGSAKIVKTSEDGVPVIEVAKSNMAQKGIIKISKSGPV